MADVDEGRVISCRIVDDSMSMWSTPRTSGPSSSPARTKNTAGPIDAWSSRLAMSA